MERVLAPFSNFDNLEDSVVYNIAPLMSITQTKIDPFDFMESETTTAVTFGYLRKNGFLEYNVKWDDLANIILKYLNNNESNIKIVSQNYSINAFDDGRVKYIDCLNKRFFVAVTDSSRNPQMYVFFAHLII